MLLLVWLNLLPLNFSQQVPDAKEIIRLADEKMRGASSQAEMTMTIQRPDWKREIKMKSWAIGTEKSLILITSPARDRGTAFLKLDKEIWNWQPRIDREIKLPPSMMMQSWMGSDFTNDDLVRESSIVEDYSHFYKGDTVINGYSCHKVELQPKEEAAVVWGRIEAFIEKNEYFQLLIKFYDEDDFLINTQVLSDVKTVDGRVIPTRMEMIPEEQKNQRTIIQYDFLDFDIDIESNFFSKQNMRRVR